MFDLAESVITETLHKAVSNPHAALNAARFYLETSGRHRGFVRREYWLRTVGCCKF